MSMIGLGVATIGIHMALLKKVRMAPRCVTVMDKRHHGEGCAERSRYPTPKLQAVLTRLEGQLNPERVVSE
jgi:hypothetical protein